MLRVLKDCAVSTEELGHCIIMPTFKSTSTMGFLFGVVLHQHIKAIQSVERRKNCKPLFVRVGVLTIPSCFKFIYRTHFNALPDNVNSLTSTILKLQCLYEFFT